MFWSSWALLLFSFSQEVHTAPQPERAQAIREAFEFAWDGYYKYAFPRDEAQPVSNGPGSSVNGWGSTAVDALSTAIVMNSSDIVGQILDFIPTIDFSKSTATDGSESAVSVFETTIRYLAGMIAGYDMLSDPAGSGLAQIAGQAKVDAVLEQAVHLANNMSFAFETPSGVPSNTIVLSSRTHQQGNFVPIAACGTLVLEWTRLSDLTGNTTYANLTQKAESYLLNPAPAENEPWPGLIGATVYLDNGTLTNANGGWTSGSDSFYEYLIKMFVYDSDRFSAYKDRWVLAAESSMAHLASSPSSRSDLTFLAQFSGQELVERDDELSCFDGGNFILGGTVLGRQDVVDFGLELVNGCHATYAVTATHIGPFAFGWDSEGVPANQTEFFKENGFYIRNAVYGLNPEMIESYYYAYQATGDKKYQNWAWDAWVAINDSCRTSTGFGGLLNVNDANGGIVDGTAAFFFAEVLKYSYLIQAEPGPWTVGGNSSNDWVFNTEAHPIKVVKDVVQQGNSSGQAPGSDQDQGQKDPPDQPSRAPRIYADSLRPLLTVVASAMLALFILRR